MSDGLHIRWRETAPDRGLLSFALSQIDALHGAWPETLQCNIVIERAADRESGHFHAHVELDLGRRCPRVRAEALHVDAYVALRRAFGELRASMPAYAGDELTASIPGYAVASLARRPPAHAAKVDAGVPPYAGDDVAA